MLLESSGFTVVDLGVDVSPESFSQRLQQSISRRLSALSRFEADHDHGGHG